jgi:hypothetical protein
MTHAVYAVASREKRRRRGHRIWIPIILVWLLLLPFVLLLAPLVFVVFLVLGVNPFRAVAVYWQTFKALRGVRIVVENPQAPISIRIF